jgi:hypothetical protein
MAVSIDLPEDIEEMLEKQWGNLPRHALEALAIEGYRTGVLTAGHRCVECWVSKRAGRSTN